MAVCRVDLNDKIASIYIRKYVPVKILQFINEIYRAYIIIYLLCTFYFKIIRIYKIKIGRPIADDQLGVIMGNTPALVRP